MFCICLPGDPPFKPFNLHLYPIRGTITIYTFKMIHTTKLYILIILGGQLQITNIQSKNLYNLML